MHIELVSIRPFVSKGVLNIVPSRPVSETLLAVKIDTSAQKIKTKRKPTYSARQT